MLGYKYTTEESVLDDVQEIDAYFGYPKENTTTQHWVDYQYSSLDEFYYIIYDESLFDVLGEPIEFDVTVI